MEMEAALDWRRWQVLAGDDPIGLIEEEREWLGEAWGPARFTAVVNPTGEMFGATWRRSGFDSPDEALEALAGRLEAPAWPATLEDLAAAGQPPPTEV